MPKGIYIKTKEHRKNLSLSHKGKKHSEETKRKMSKIHKGRKFTPEWRKKLSDARKKGIKKRKEIGEKAHNWKGGKNITAVGYIKIYKSTHPFQRKNYVFEHRLVMEKILGRYLTPEERVHHKGIKYPINSVENKQDNRPKNLRLFANESKHQIFHKRKLTSCECA